LVDSSAEPATWAQIQGHLIAHQYEGLIKTYNKPFSAENHDALTPNDYVMVHYEGDSVFPVY